MERARATAGVACHEAEKHEQEPSPAILQEALLVRNVEVNRRGKGHGRLSRECVTRRSVPRLGCTVRRAAAGSALF